MGHLQRRLAHRLVLPPLPRPSEWGGPASGGGRLLRGHRLAVTAVALTADERTVYSTGKEGGIWEYDVETGARQRFAQPAAGGMGQDEPTGTPADWVQRGPRQSSRASLLAAAASSDGRYLAVGGGDKKVHVWDARSRQYIKVRLAGGVGMGAGGGTPAAAQRRYAGSCRPAGAAHRGPRRAASSAAAPCPPTGVPGAQGRGHLPGLPRRHARAVQRQPGPGDQAVEPG